MNELNEFLDWLKLHNYKFTGGVNFVRAVENAIKQYSTDMGFDAPAACKEKPATKGGRRRRDE